MAPYLFTLWRARLTPADGPLHSTAPLTSTSSRLMFHIKTVPALARAGAGSPFKRLLSSRRLRSTVTSTSATQAEPRDVGSSRGDARHETARSSPGRPGREGRDRAGTDNSTAAANEVYVDFEQTREAYKSKDSLELLRSLVVFKLCSFDFLVDKNKEVMKSYLTVLPGN